MAPPLLKKGASQVGKQALKTSMDIVGDAMQEWNIKKTNQAPDVRRTQRFSTSIRSWKMRSPRTEGDQKKTQSGTRKAKSQACTQEMKRE